MNLNHTAQPKMFHYMHFYIVLICLNVYYINGELVNRMFTLLFLAHLNTNHKLRVTYCDQPYSALVRCLSTVLPGHLLWNPSLDLVKNRFLKCNFQNISCPNYNAQRFHILYTTSSSPLPGVLNYTPRVYRDSLGGWSILHRVT